VEKIFSGNRILLLQMNVKAVLRIMNIRGNQKAVE
jgi:hypothetical protein